MRARSPLERRRRRPRRARSPHSATVLAGRVTVLPIPLLPTRLEAHFQATSATAKLLLRAYPDEIQVNTFDPRLSPTRRDLADRYSAAVDANPDDRTAGLAHAAHAAQSGWRGRLGGGRR